MARLREMTPADLGAVFALRTSTRENRVTMEELADEYGITVASLAVAMATGVRGWLVEDEGVVIAFAMGDRSNGEVQVVAVRPGHEGRGHGKAVLAAVVDWLLAEGHAEVWLYAARDPAVRATGFYRRLGWTPTGEVKGSDEVLRLMPRA